MFPLRPLGGLAAIRPAVLFAVGLLLFTQPAMPQAAQLTTEPALVVYDPLQQRMTSATEEMTFVVYPAKNATLHDLAVTVLEIKDPDSKPLQTSGSFAVSYDKRAFGHDGARVTLRPAGGVFDRLGDYSAVLQIEASTEPGGKGKVLSAKKPARFSRVKPDLTITGLRDTTFRVTRSGPWSKGVRNDIVLTMQNRESSELAVSVTAEPITTTGDSPEVVDGKITVDPPITNAQVGVTLLTLKIEVAEPGRLQTRVRLSVAGQQEIEEIPFKLVVTDELPAPLATIFIGVLLAFLINFIANRVKPEKENHFRVLQLLERLVRLRLRTADHRTQVDNLIGRLNAVAMSNNAGFSADAKVKLETLNQEIDTLEKMIDAERQAAQQKLLDVRARVNALRGRADGAAVDAAAAVLDRAEVLVADSRYGDGMAALDTLAARVAELEKTITARGGRPEDDAFGPTASGAPSPVFAINVLTNPTGRAAQKQVVFEVAGSVARTDTLRWNFGDGETAEASGARVRHTYLWSGSYNVTVELPNGTVVAGQIDIAPSDLERGAGDAAKRLLWLDVVLSVIALAIATATGILALYAGKTFGSVAQYAEAFLWGFGIDGSVRGFGNVIKKLLSNG